MIGESQPIHLTVKADKGKIDSDKAVSLGLIVTELVINAIKYAFPTQRPDALILVTYEARAEEWKLIVADNGIGKRADGAGSTNPGLGTAIVKALVTQLEAEIDTVSSPSGMTVSITRASVASHMPQAA